MKAAVEINNLCVDFGALRAVADASFAVPQGTSFGIIGESGSGKSTILRAIAGLNNHSEGQIRIDGDDVPQPRDKAFYRRVQMVFQDPYGSLHPRRMIRATLLEPLKIFGFEDTDTRIAQTLKDVGLDPAFAYRYPHQLSGGQRQRVAIARALLLEPQILLLVILGVLVGVVFGALPGLSATMAIALMLPITFAMAPDAGMAMLVATYLGGVSGGLVSAMLLGIPGTPASARLLDTAPGTGPG